MQIYVFKSNLKSIDQSLITSFMVRLIHFTAVGLVHLDIFFCSSKQIHMQLNLNYISGKYKIPSLYIL